ncbi:organic radical activating enzyme [Desulfohalotomaculum tongense]|uniref:7-carboxy-7-deazaguanine synthase QueE n=1 Tax=Desulforadius tongensis TaxID=1216062 RepID=UPI00195ABB46|nr:7-carboxy-7-deazaguanine synthase QueE [Desulforadius tongensis]MBM7855285.1 organic radical activating enzyme [Desulforadius tongensis]
MHVPLLEIFSSVQGEGPLLGCRQIFLRLAGCNLNCCYCDTPINVGEKGCKIEPVSGSSRFVYLPWPLELEQVVRTIHKYYHLSKHHSVSITGGEPLQHHGLLRKMLPRLKGSRYGIFLETNGTLPNQLRQVIDYVNIISMDIKLPSVANIKPCWNEHREFIRIALSREIYLYIKVVVSDKTSREDLNILWQMLKEEAPGVTLVIQPVTPHNGINPPSSQQLLHWQEQGLEYLKDVRVIGQTHKTMGVL